MQEWVKKTKRLGPIVKHRQRLVQNELATLTELVTKKQHVNDSMVSNQQKYMTGVESLNNIRASSARENLVTLESSLDHIKLEWYRLYQNVKELEKAEAEQRSRVNQAQTDLKSIQKLQARYEAEARKVADRREQNQLDEIAARRHSQDRGAIG